MNNNLNSNDCYVTITQKVTAQGNTSEYINKYGGINEK